MHCQDDENTGVKNAGLKNAVEDYIEYGQDIPLCHHSTETAILRVLSDILQAVDRGDFAALVLLDLSAAFDTVDHEILIQRLQLTQSIHCSVLQWFRSYLLGRTQHVCRGSARSSAVHLVCGVPQGSVIGPILFILYMADLVALIESLGLSPHLYADDTQIYGSCTPSHVDMFLSEVTNCVAAVADWMQSNRLQLSDNKTEFVWCTTDRRQHRLSIVGPTIGFLVRLQPLRFIIQTALEILMMMMMMMMICHSATQIMLTLVVNI